MPKNLMRRGQLWSARYVVPVKYRAVVGASTIVRSLGTSDVREAERLARRKLVEIEDEVQTMVRAGSDNPRDPRWLLSVAADLNRQAERGEIEYDDVPSLMSAALDSHLAERGETEGDQLDPEYPLEAAKALHKRRKEADPSYRDPDLERAVRGVVDGSKLAPAHVRTIRTAYKAARGEPFHTVDSAAEEWRKHQLGRKIRLSTVDAQQRALSQFSAWAENPELSDVGVVMASKYVAEKIIPLDRALATKQGYLIYLVGFWNWTGRRGWTKANPWEGLGRDLEGTTRATEDNEERHWRPWLDPELAKLTARPTKLTTIGQIRNVGMIALWTGMRTNEVCELRTDDVDTEAGTFRIRAGKTAAARRLLPIHSAILPLIKTLCAASEDGYVVPALKPTGRDGKRSKSLVNRAGEWIRGFRVKGDDLFVFYGLRHTFSTALLRAGVDTPTRQALMAHSAEDITTRVYAAAGFSMETLRAALERIDFPTARP